MDVNIWMITGWRMAGKTTFCRMFAQMARTAGWNVAGLLSPAVFTEGVKDTIVAEDLRTGETRPVAHVLRQNPADMVFGKWFFDRPTLAWGNQVLQTSVPCDLLVIDELGPLEFNLHTGWQSAFEVLKSAQFRLALVVIRPELVEMAQSVICPSKTIQIDDPGQVDRLIQEHLLLLKNIKKS